MRRCFLIVLPLLLMACAGPAGQQPLGNQPDPLAKQQAQPGGAACDPGKEHWRQSGPPKRGGVLKRSGGYGVGTMTHIDLSAPDRPNPGPVPNVYGYLVTPRACYYEDSAMEPDLAKSWEISQDGRTWTFKLNPDVRWHNKPPVNGRAFTSADVGWTIDHVKKGGGIRVYWDGVEHQEPDAQTVVLRLKEPDAEFLEKIGDPSNAMFAKEVFETHGDSKQIAVGTRSFMLKEFRSGQFATVVRNPDWKELGEDGRPLPYIDEIQSIVFGDYAAEVAAMRSGQLDFNTTTGFRKLEADALKQASPKLQLYEDVAATPWGLWLNHRRKPLDDVRVRRALNLAIDREEIIIRQGGGAVLSGYIPPAIGKFAWPQEKVVEKFKPNPEQAKRLLAEAGFGPGQLKIKMQSNDRYLQDAEVAQQHLKNVGIEVALSNEGAKSANSMLSAPDWDTVWSGQSPSSTFADRWMSVWQTGSSQNYLGFSDPEADRLIVAQRHEMDPAKRKQALDQLQDVLYDRAAYAPAISLIYYRFYSCQLRNMRPTHPSQNMEGVKNAWLDQTGC